MSSGYGGGRGGGGEGYTTLLNNCGTSQIENSKVSPEGIGMLEVSHHTSSLLLISDIKINNCDNKDHFVLRYNKR